MRRFLLHFTLILHFAAIITFCGVTVVVNHNFAIMFSFLCKEQSQGAGGLNQTPFTAVVQKPETRKMNEFLKETIFFFIFCFSFLLFVFKFRATGVLCFPNNRKYKSDRMLNFSLVRSAFARKASCCSWRFAILEKFLP